MVGALLLLQSLLILAMLHPLQLLRHGLSVVADDVTGCRVVNVVLRNRVHDDISNVIWANLFRLRFLSVNGINVATAFFFFLG